MYAVALVVMVYITFLVAYLSPGKGVLVMVNVFGEADFELVFLTFMVPFTAYFILLELKWMLSRSESTDHSDEASSSQSAQSQ